MIKQIQLKKASEIKQEFVTMTIDCQHAYSAWYQDRNNTELFQEYQHLLKMRTEMINRYKSFYLAIND